MTKRRWTVIGLLAGTMVGLVVGLALFQPWRLVTSRTVTEALPTTQPQITQPQAASPAAPSAEPGGQAPITLAEGRLVSHEHDTSGRVRLLRLPDGSRVIRLEGLSTSDGPALHVWLSDQPVRRDRAGWRVFDDGAFVDLGDLKGNRGDQNYAVPRDADLQRLTSVSIWCARFRVSFGAAALAPLPPGR